MLQVHVTNKRETELGTTFDAAVRISPSIVFQGSVVLGVDGVGVESVLDANLRRCLNGSGLRWVHAALERAAELVRDGASQAAASYSQAEETARQQAESAARDLANSERAAAYRVECARARAEVLARASTMTALELLTYIVRDGGAELIVDNDDADYDPAIAAAVISRTEALRAAQD